MCFLKIAFVCLALSAMTAALVFPEFKPISSYDSKLKPLDIVPVTDWSDPYRPKAWFASWPMNHKMVILGAKNFDLSINCHSKSFSLAEDYLTEMEFCFGTTPNCYKLTTDGQTKTVNLNSQKNSGKARLRFERSKGGSATIDSVGPKVFVSTKVFCKIKNRMGVVQSNTLEIQDIRGRTPDIQFMEGVPVSKLAINSPHNFTCMKGAGTPSLDDPPFTIDWSICEKLGMRLKNCQPVRINTITNYWPYHYKPNGDLFVPYWTREAVTKLGGHQLLCTVDRLNRAAVYNPLGFVEGGKPISSISISEPGTETAINLLYSPNIERFMPCNFQIGKGSYKVTWLRKGADGITTTLASGENKEYGITVMAEGASGIVVKAPITDKTAGLYTCEVTWMPEGGLPTQKAVGTYKISVSYFPSISKKMVPTIYVVDGNNGTVKCLFEGMKITPSLAINGQDMNMKDAATIRASVQSINTAFNKVMASLKVSVTPLPVSAGAQLVYTSENMEYKSSLQNLPSSHQVTCIGKNDVGSVRHNTVLKVVPKPIVDKAMSPTVLNCTECSAAVDHQVKCSVTNLAEINASGVIFDQYWLLGNARVDNLIASADAPARKYLIQSADKTVLTIKKIDNIDFRNEVNKQGTIQCVLTLAYPATAKLPEGLMTTGAERGMFYISSRTDLKKDLTTTIKLTKIAEVIKTGSMMWLIAVILAFIIIIIIMAFTYYYCRQRQSGEEYNVDAKEKQQGNDPELEVAEKEAFPVYERPEDGPIRGSRASLDDSIHVGSDDEDEVLAEYDVDIGKFDEEGSFIGQYAVNDGPQSSNRRLPPVGTNTEV